MSLKERLVIVASFCAVLLAVSWIRVQHGRRLERVEIGAVVEFKGAHWMERGTDGVWRPLQIAVLPPLPKTLPPHNCGDGE